MKRLVMAFILLAVIIIICVSGKVCVKQSTAELETALKKCIDSYNSEDYSVALTLSKELENLLVSKEEKLSVFVNKSIIEEIGVCVAKIRSYAKYQNDEFLTECDSLFILLTHMKNDENMPYMGVF